MHVALEVFDWQGATNPLGVPGEVSAIWVESPITAAPVNILPAATFSTGSQPTSSVFETDLISSQLHIVSGGDYPVLICVESTSPNTYQPQIPGGESFIFPDAPLAAYCMGTVFVSGEQPFHEALDVTGDVKLSVVRDPALSITGIKLDWTENTNISPFYAVYADDNPYNGLNANIFVGEFTTNVVTIDISNWPVFSTTGAYVFGVKGRTVSGLPESESPHMSQLAFVELEDFDGGASPITWLEGYGNALYQWETANPGQIDGSTSLRSKPEVPINQWGAIAGEVLPAIPNSGLSFTEFAHISSAFSWLAYYKNFSAGFTHSIPPVGEATYENYDSTSDFYCIMDGTWNWAIPSGPPPGGGWTGLVQSFGWNPGSTFFGWRFFDCPHGPAAITRMALPQLRTDAGTIRPAFAWATCVWDNNQDWLEIDEIAVVIY
jgi:hypothetical protein